MRTIAIINQKGGCGKTTSAINLAACFAARSVRTLLVDMDPQSHCAAGLGIPEERIDLDISAALKAAPDAPLPRDRIVWNVSRRLDLVPSTMMLAGLESSRGGLRDQQDTERRLRSVLERLARPDDAPEEAPDAVSRYDACVIDCPPSIGLLSYNAIAAGREIIIPVETSYFSMRGAAKQLQTIKTIARRLGVRLRPRILVTMHDPSRRGARDLLRDLRERFGEIVIPLPIRFDPALKDAARLGQSIERCAPESAGAEDYRALCEWLMEHAEIERDETDADPEAPPHGAAPPATPAGAHAMPVASGTPENGPPAASRAAEIAQRAKALSGSRPAPLRRSMMPHRPVAIEVSDERVVTPTAREPIERVRHLLGVRVVTGGVLFVQPLSIGDDIRVAGSFNGWDPAAAPMRRNERLGVHELHLALPEGTHEYKLVVEGRWMLDPYNADRVASGIGSENNTVRAGPGGGMDAGGPEAP